MKLDRSRATLAVIDIQQAFEPAVLDFETVARNAAILVQAARILGLPVFVTEQYPKGLGSTVAVLAEQLEGVAPVEKTAFSAMAAEQFSAPLKASGRDQVLLCGIESHVCVSQTAQDLIADDFEVHVAQDAVTSRTEENRQLGLRKMQQAGAVPTSVEMALFELLREAGTPEFRQIQALVK